MAADRQLENLTWLWLTSDPHKHRPIRICGMDVPAQHTRMEAAVFNWKKGRAAEKAIKIAEAPAVAGEELPRQKKKSNYAVDWDMVQSEKYAYRFGVLSYNEKAKPMLSRPVPTMMLSRKSVIR